MNFLQAFEENSLLAVAYVASAKEKGKRGEGGREKRKRGNWEERRKRGGALAPFPFPFELATQAVFAAYKTALIES